MPSRSDVFCPVLLGEVVSDKVNESDRWRMLLQLAVCARMNGLTAQKRNPPFVHQAIYLSKGYKAERYLAYADILVCCSWLRVQFGLADSLIGYFNTDSGSLYRTGRVRCHDCCRCHRVSPIHVQFQGHGDERRRQVGPRKRGAVYGSVQALTDISHSVKVKKVGV